MGRDAESCIRMRDWERRKNSFGSSLHLSLFLALRTLAQLRWFGARLRQCLKPRMENLNETVRHNQPCSALFRLQSKNHKRMNIWEWDSNACRAFSITNIAVLYLAFAAEVMYCKQHQGNRIFNSSPLGRRAIGGGKAILSSIQKREHVALLDDGITLYFVRTVRTYSTWRERTDKVEWSYRSYYSNLFTCIVRLSCCVQ